MRRLSIAIALLLVAPLVSAQVYKWTDAKGTTHYSETPPPTGTKYSQVTVSGADEPAASGSGNDTSAAAPASSSSSSQGNNNQPMADTPENRAKMCTSLKANMALLQGSGPVVVQNGGQQQLLNADQRKQQLDATQSTYQQYCGS